MVRALISALLVVGVLAAERLGADDGPADRALLVVLDVSGSMNEAVAGGIKRDLAWRGLLRSFEALPDGTLTGLRFLGQGPSDDECTASESAVAFAPFEASDWERARSRVRWDGATPLVYSMREAFDELRRANAVQSELLIIGDGEETCGEDPVGVARAEADGIRIHTISLGEDTSHQLAGIALVTNGTYARAFDESTFETATGVVIPAVDIEPSAGGDQVSAPNRLEVILDVSNSMWGQIDGRAKIELARDALAGALKDLPADVPVGLRAYGHRVDFENKIDGCADTERLLAPAAGNGPAVVDLANTLTPRGQTPIARALEETGADLQTEGGTAAILLVSDGAESCGGDPEATAADLRASGLQVVVHTVGLGVAADEAAALSALAEAGGGTYFDAPTADDLLKGLTNAVRTSTGFVLQQDEAPIFPADALRVRGGESVAEADVVEAGVYHSFTAHMFREERYFAVRGAPGETLKLRGMVAALEIGRTRAGDVTFQGFPNMMMGRGVDALGERIKGRRLLVRGDMGTWAELDLPVGDDGLARFVLGRAQGNVHRDMVFTVAR